MHLLLFSVVIAIVAAMATYSDIIGVKRAFESAHIPQDLHIAFHPKTLLGVTFPQSGSLPPITIKVGMPLSANATALPPTYSVSPANIGHGPFVIALIDPDALTPQNPNISQINHFLGGNFFVGKQHDCHGLLVNTTPAVTEYYGPHPPKVVDSDPHRYIFLLFKQPPRFNEQKEVIPGMDLSSRRYFNISHFAADVGLGAPIGGTFVYVGRNT